MENTCTSMVDSCQCVAKPIQYCRFFFKLKKRNKFEVHFKKEKLLHFIVFNVLSSHHFSLEWRWIYIAVIWICATPQHWSDPIRGQTEWKPQLQTTNQLITWITALSNSVNMWAMPCRATQDRQVMAESSDKTRSTAEGNGELLQYFALRTPWTVWKCKKKWHLEMNSPGE